MPAVTFPWTPDGPFSKDFDHRFQIGVGTTAIIVLEVKEDWSVRRVVKLPTTYSPHIIDFSRANILREIEVYKRLDANPHPFVLQSLGSDRANYALYLRHASHGNINGYRQLCRTPIDSELKLKWCFQLASAVQHIHSLNIFHCDISIGNNILIDEHLCIKLCDSAGSSMDFRPPEAAAKRQLSIHDYRAKTEWTRDDLRQIDVLTMGSMFYFFSTLRFPFEEVEIQDNIMDLYAKSISPDTSCLPLGDLIIDIWKEVVVDIDEICLRVVASIPLPL